MTHARLRAIILGGAALLLAAVCALWLRARGAQSHEALADAARPVTVVCAKETTFRAARSYVGAVEPWNAARVGPQYVSAYVSTVLVRPGAVVKRNQVLATLDCRNSSALSREIAARAKALEEKQAAVEHESARVKELAAGNFASQNEAEQLAARAASEKAEIESLRASMVTRSLEVDDCILRAPFDAEVSDRFVDPGAYVRPSEPVIAVVDRSMVRVVADAPEGDFGEVAPGAPVQIAVAATGARLDGKIARRAPAADETTRTVRFEVDLANAAKALPVGATARLTLDVGQPAKAIELPLRAATLRGEKATLWLVDGERARRTVAPVLGEREGLLFLAPVEKLVDGARVVIEGRALLEENDRVAAKEAGR